MNAAPETSIPDQSTSEGVTRVEMETPKTQFKLKERYIIDFAEPIEMLNMNGGKAYKVNDLIDKDKLLFALICSNETSPRHSILPYIKTIKTPCLLNLIEYGTVSVPNTNEISMALIYQRPLGGRVIDDPNQPYRDDMNEVQSLWISLLAGLQDLYSYGITHRSIRANNLFYLDETKKHIVLGDCAAAFPAYNQPAVYETTDSLMAKKESRGNGTDRNDIYALAVLGLFLYLGKEVGSELPDSDVLNFKLKKGSYNALMGETKLPVSFSNIFRNMLIDIPASRWGISACIEAFENHSGKVTFVAPQESTKKALIFAGQKYYNPIDVAYAMLQNPKEAYALYDNGKISEWIKDCLDNEKLALALDKNIKATVDNSQDHELSVAKICIFLAPHFPIKLGSVCLFPDAFSKSLYFAYRHNLPLNDYLRICTYDLMRLWYSNQIDDRMPPIIGEARTFAQSPAIGYGMDRIMYELDDDIPCLSKLVESDYICTPTKILRVLNNSYDNTQEKPYDNHLIAYLRSRLGKKIDGILVDINSKIDALEASAVLRLYTTLQNKFGPQELPHLAQWLSIFSMPLIKSYHNIKYQKFLEKELIKVNKSGKLYEIQELLEKEEARKKDTSEYSIARKTAAKLLAEKNMLTSNDNKWEETARDMAAKGASLLAVIVMIISFVLNLFGAIKL